MVTPKDVQKILGVVPLGTKQEVSVRQHTTRLDNTGTKEPQKQKGFSKSKIIKSGSLIETYEYERPVRYGFSPKIKTGAVTRKTERSSEHRTRTIIRAINNIRRLTHLNFTENDKFLTFTFADTYEFDINKLDACLPYYKKAMRKLRTWYPDLKYITVPEFQKRGAVHYHILCNIPFIRKSELNKIWKYGWSKPKAIHGTTHLAFYLVKYLSKKFDDKRKQGHRLYYTSRGLERPKTLYGPYAEAIANKLKTDHSNAVQYETSYDTEHNGTVDYSQYVKEK